MTFNNERFIEDAIATLRLINYQMADLAGAKEELERELAIRLEHGEEGSKTYKFGHNKVTVTSGFIYTINKNMVSTCNLPDIFNPIREKITYEIDKKVLRDAEKYGDSEVLMQLSNVVSKKPKKVHVKVVSNEVME